jgi:integrase/recombinase XerD
MQATAHISFFTTQDKRTKEDLCPVKLCITHKRKQRYFSIRERLTKNDWQFITLDDIPKVTGESPRGKYRDIHFDYDRIKKEAEDIINAITNKGKTPFSFSQFEDKYLNRTASWDNLFEAIWGHVNELKNEGRFGYASSFECSLRSIKEFHEGKKYKFKRKDKIATRENLYLSGRPLRFIDITPDWLKRYEKYMQDEGLSKSTQGIYVRNLRVLFNIAIKKHKAQVPYPFIDHKPKKAQGRKLALTAHQISLIAGYKTEHPQEQFYRDLFMFSFLANGMNIADIARLKFSNIESGEINFVREKTKRKETQETIRVPVTRQMQSIIDKHRNRAIGHDAYVFPILKPDWTDAACFMFIRGVVKTMNQYLKRMAVSVGIQENVSTYTARHSWATIAKNSGASTEFIKESLGHSNVSVTEAYLKQFEKATRREHSDKMEGEVYNNKAV